MLRYREEQIVGPGKTMTVVVTNEVLGRESCENWRRLCPDLAEVSES